MPPLPASDSELTDGATWRLRAMRYGHHALAKALVRAGVHACNHEGSSVLDELRKRRWSVPSLASHR